VLVSLATGVVAAQALPGIELETEFTQTCKRDPWNLPYRHLRRPILRHPNRELHERVIRLSDNQGEVITMPLAPRNNDRLPAPRMKLISDRRFTTLIVGIMSPFRRHRAPS
jgi:hypothetical protein